MRTSTLEKILMSGVFIMGADRNSVMVKEKHMEKQLTQLDLQFDAQ